MVADLDDRETLQEIVNDTKLSEGYLILACDIEFMEPKSPEDIYKAHLLDGRASAGASVDSGRQNLAATFVNAFVNAGFGQKLQVVVLQENWLFKNKEHGKASAAASLDMILLWDVDSGLLNLTSISTVMTTCHCSGTQLTVGALVRSAKGRSGLSTHSFMAASSSQGLKRIHLFLGSNLLVSLLHVKTII